MLFNSLTFFVLLTVAVGLYWALPWHCARLGVLFGASILFYGFHHWPSVFLLLFTIGFNYVMGRGQGRRRSIARLILTVSVNLSLLFWFKYAAFVADNINYILAKFSAELAVPRPRCSCRWASLFSPFRS